MSANNLAMFERIVDLIGHLAWPVTTVILVLIIRRHVYALLTALSDRIKDTRSNVSLGPGGIEIARVADDTVPGLTDSGKKLDAKLNADANFKAQLKEWLNEQGSVLSPTAFVNGAEDEGLRIKAVQHFNL